MRINRIWDSALPSATPGRAFTASIGQETVTPQDKFLDHLCIGFTQDIDTGAVVIESGIDIISLLTLRFGAETRIQMDKQTVQLKDVAKDKNTIIIYHSAEDKKLIEGCCPAL